MFEELKEDFNIEKEVMEILDRYEFPYEDCWAYNSLTTYIRHWMKVRFDNGKVKEARVRFIFETIEVDCGYELKLKMNFSYLGHHADFGDTYIVEMKRLLTFNTLVAAMYALMLQMREMLAKVIEKWTTETIADMIEMSEDSAKAYKFLLSDEDYNTYNELTEQGIDVSLKGLLFKEFGLKEEDDYKYSIVIE